MAYIISSERHIRLEYHTHFHHPHSTLLVVVTRAFSMHIQSHSIIPPVNTIPQYYYPLLWTEITTTHEIIRILNIVHHMSKRPLPPFRVDRISLVRQ